MKKYILLILLAGCVSKPTYPPLPQSVGSKQLRSAKSYVAEPVPFKGIISWTNAPLDYTNGMFSCIEGSTDLKTWISLMKVPYAVTNVYVLTNQPTTHRFYRVYNGFN